MDPVITVHLFLLQGTGFISADELICGGKGSCLDFKAGNITANIIKITSLETENAGYPTILLDDGSQNQNLILYFDEIQNLNSNGGDAVKITEGIATLIGRRIYALNGMSVDLNNIIISALIQSDEIISETKGINISNSDEQVIIDANYIEGSNGNDGVIRSASGSNYLIRNAKITNTYTSSPSIGIYLDTGSQTIEIENLIIVTGTETNDFSIFRNSTTNIDIKNLGLFVKKAISMHITLKIGTGTGTGENFKYIISNDIT
ncbi:MAG: hypothetical protein KDD00_01220 [Ignavibacteriae bacterium]|nr:hypothetical protein [Ignavibacteriota bacterium]